MLTYAFEPSSIIISNLSRVNRINRLKYSNDFENNRIIILIQNHNDYIELICSTTGKNKSE